jgi:hypothetical protein
MQGWAPLRAVGRLYVHFVDASLPGLHGRAHCGSDGYGWGYPATLCPTSETELTAKVPNVCHINDVTCHEGQRSHRSSITCVHLEIVCDVQPTLVELYVVVGT